MDKITVLGKLIGRKIIECRESGTGFVMKLDNGIQVKIAVDLIGGPGADSEWYQWAVLYVNGERIGDEA